MNDYLIGFVFVVITFGAVIVMVSPSEEQRVKQAAQDEADRVPQFLSEKDGCKVYAFKQGGTWHYFTNCGKTTTTEKNYTEYCGKACVRHKTESITTENQND